MQNQFSDLGISAPLVQALTEMKIVIPTEIQQKPFCCPTLQM
jgi:ATP-dependent RNA helicase DeaD